MGHDHAYERFAPIDASGGFDELRGVRQFVVGTGGKSLGPRVWYAPNSQLRRSDTAGVLQLTLHPGEFSWRFLRVRTGRVADSGARDCH